LEHQHQHHSKAPPDQLTKNHLKSEHSLKQHGDKSPVGLDGHNHHAMMIADFKKRFLVVLTLTIPIILLSPMIQMFIGVDWKFKGSSVILSALSSVVFFYGGWPFLKGWVREVKTKNPGMMFLIGFAITVAYIYSVAVVSGLQGMDFFWELATLILIMLLGHWIEMKSIAGASKELELLVQLMPSDAHMVIVPDGFKSNDTETVVFVIVNNELVGYIALSDEIRPESVEAVKTLKQNDIKSILLTGDNNKVAKSVSETIGMHSFIAEVLPHQKLEKIVELQNQGEFVAMTGDGVNDAPALAQADVGIAVGSGSDIAAETAGIVLVNSNPKDIVSLILFGKATYRKMVQNLIWATGYNIIALPLAAGVLYKLGILLSPAAGAVLMTASTVVVAINASLLKLKN
jgi:cation transport ATPase